jgi:hypothetical protein
LTRAFGSRPSGDACASSKIAFGDFVEPPFPYLGFESPLCGCDSNLNKTSRIYVPCGGEGGIRTLDGLLTPRKVLRNQQFTDSQRSPSPAFPSFPPSLAVESATLGTYAVTGHRRSLYSHRRLDCKSSSRPSSNVRPSCSRSSSIRSRTVRRTGLVCASESPASKRALR